MATPAPTPTPDPRDAVVARITGLFLDARKGRMGGHTHWGKIIVTSLRSLADIDASRLDWCEGDGEETQEFAALLTGFKDQADRHLERLAELSKSKPFYELPPEHQAAEEADALRRARGACRRFMQDLRVESLTWSSSAIAPCTEDDGMAWYYGDQLDPDGDGSDPTEPKPWRHMRLVEGISRWNEDGSCVVTKARKWFSFHTWARLEDEHSTWRERRSVIDHSMSEPDPILGWTIERSWVCGEVPCPRCNSVPTSRYGDERKTPSIIRDTCPFCGGSAYLSNTYAQVVVYVRNK